MAEETQVQPGFDIREAWPVVQLFRTFRIAIHPSKLVLGLALLVSVYAEGVILDAIWPSGSRAVTNEAGLYQAAHSLEEFGTLKSLSGGSEGLFHAVSQYEAHEFTQVVRGVLSWIENPLGGTENVPEHVYNFAVIGPLWIAREHAIFGTLMAALFLASWSLFGGAIARLAAVHVARRDDKVSIRQALNFSLGKFLSFFSAPIIPLLIVLGVGWLTALASLVGSIPYLGPIVVGGAFVLVLIGAFVQTLVVLGAVGGFNLMYPTISVEGSDSFDAISRSFSYVYARPWRMLVLTIVEVIYGALTYLFVRMFVMLMLVLAHYFVAKGIYQCDVNGQALLPSIWPGPAATGRLLYTVNYHALNWGQAVGAALLSFWIYLTIGMLGAFVISFYFSANTIIYYLMRHKLDATEMDDVYLEQTEEEFITGGAETAVRASVAAPEAEPPASA